MRLTIQGGVWKNTEDEILKAAVMKYGMNQWARISSLLVRKSAKQCKARWYEWLDPSIKKTEWTREEEERLLHLAKIMPTQWRTIAPIIGRTPAQCLEHYERLLDAAQDRDADSEAKDDPRRLRPGEIDPNPEAKPARPDPVDMDEDEKEMLSEARARLANTRGKKAKRKAREKQLEEARRLAFLQKKRELKAAGIETGRKRQHKRKWGIDYLNEIPFEKRPALGFFDTSKDRDRTRTLRDDSKFIGKSLAEIDGERRDDKEERLRKADAKRQKLHQKSSLPDYLERINKLNDPKRISNRSQLVLPAPQVDDSELDALAKVGGAAGASNVDAVGRTPGATLMGSARGTTPAPTPMRTPRTPLGEDRIMMESKRMLGLTSAATPLKGGDSTPLQGADFTDITPRASTHATPNVMAMSLTPQHGVNRTPGGPTPVQLNQGSAGGRSVHGTPLRDEMDINAKDAGRYVSTKQQHALLRRRLKEGLSDLPSASNEYSVVMPDIPVDMAISDDEDGDMEEDAEDLIAKRAAARQAAQAQALRMRSAAVQRSLPRPSKVNPKMPKESVLAASSSDDISADDLEQAAALTHKEMLLLLRHDAVKFPYESVDDAKKGKKGKTASQSSSSVPAMRVVTEQQLVNARLQIDAECERLLDDAKLATVDVQSIMDDMSSKCVFVPSRKNYVNADELSKEELVEVKRQEFGMLLSRYRKEAKRTQKLQDKLQVLCGGYEKRARKLSDKLTDSHTNLEQTVCDLGCFRSLRSQEEIALPVRISTGEAEVKGLSETESELQTRFRMLKEEKERLQQLLAAHDEQ